MRFLETDPKGKSIVLVLLQVARGLCRNPGALHLLVMPRKRELLRVKPDARRVLEGAPVGLSVDLGKRFHRAGGFQPALLHDVFGPLGGEAVQVGRPGTAVAGGSEDVARVIVGEYEEEVGLAVAGARHPRSAGDCGGSEQIPTSNGGIHGWDPQIYRARMDACAAG